jgi:hypothetical protein
MSTGSVSYAPSSTGIRVKTGTTYSKGVMKSNENGYFEIAKINSTDILPDAIQQINITDTNSAQGITFYPTFVANSGTGQTMYIDLISGPLSYTPFNSAMNLTNLNATGTVSGVTLSASGGIVGVKTININNASSNALFYPTFVQNAGADKPIYTRAESLSFIPNLATLSIGNTATSGTINLGATAGGYINNPNGNITIDPTNTLNVLGNLSTTGTITGATLSGSNVYSSGNISASGTITGATFVGNGSALTGINNMNVFNSNAGSTFFPVFVGSTGAGQTMYADAISGPLSYYPSTGTLNATTFNGNATTATTATKVTLTGSNNSANYPLVLSTEATNTDGTFGLNIASNSSILCNPNAGSITINSLTSSGITLNGNMTFANGTRSIIATGGGFTVSGSVITIEGSNSPGVILKSDGVSSLTATSTGVNIIGTVTGTTFVGNGSALTNLNNMTITDTNTSSTFFPVFVGSAGAGQIMHADTSSGPLSYNPSACALTLGATSASLVVGATTGTVTIGTTAGTINVGTGFTGVINLGGTGGGYIKNPNGNITIDPTNLLSVAGNLTATETVSGLTFSATGGIVTNGTVSGVTFIGNGSALTGINNMTITDTNTSSTFFPVFVGSTGAGQIMRADTSSGPLSYNPLACALTLGATSASLVVGATTGTITVGTTMGTINVGTGFTGVINLGGTGGGTIRNPNGNITIDPLTTLTVAGNLTATGTITSSTFVTDGSALTGGQIVNNFGDVWDKKLQGVQTWNSVSISSSGQYQTACGTVGLIYMSSDFGETWISKTTVSKNWTSVSISSTGQYQTALENGGLIYLSTDFGETWDSKTTVNQNWCAISISSSGQYQTALTGGGLIYLSTDFGETWISKTTVPRNWKSVSISSTGQYQTAVVYGSGLIYMSTDFGETWNSKTTVNQNWIDVAISSTGQYQTSCEGNFYNLYISKDFGNTWDAKYFASAYSNAFQFTGVSLSGTGQFQTATACNGPEGAIYVSIDFGVTWAMKYYDGDFSGGSISISASGQYQTTCSVYIPRILVSKSLITSDAVIISDLGASYLANSPYYLTFVGSTGANQIVYTDTTNIPLTFTPSSKLLSVGGSINASSGTITGATFVGNGSQLTGLDNMWIYNNNTSSTFFPVFVGSTGAGQTMYADSISGPLSYNPSTCALTLGATGASLVVGATTGAVTVGTTMGTINVGTGFTGVINLGGTGGGYIVNARGNILIDPLTTLTVAGNLTATGTVSGATLSATGGIVATGVVSGTTFVGNGSELTGIKNISITDVSSGTFYPVFAGSTGANQTLYVDSTIGPLQYEAFNNHLIFGSTLSILTIGGTYSSGVLNIGGTSQGYIQNGFGNINITPTDTLKVVGNLTTTGTITGATFVGNGSALTRLDNMTITDLSTTYAANTKYYLTFVVSTGANQTMYADTINTPLSFTPSSNLLSVGATGIGQLTTPSICLSSSQSFSVTGTAGGNTGGNTANMYNITNPSIVYINNTIPTSGGTNTPSFLKLPLNPQDGQVYIFRNIGITGNFNSEAFIFPNTSDSITLYPTSAPGGNTGGNAFGAKTSGGAHANKMTQVKYIYNLSNRTWYSFDYIA